MNAAPSALVEVDHVRQLYPKGSGENLLVLDDVSLSLRALGVGSSLQAVALAQPTAHANRVSYARGGALTEWYANGPAGLEQPADHAEREE